MVLWLHIIYGSFCSILAESSHFDTYLRATKPFTRWPFAASSTPLTQTRLVSIYSFPRPVVWGRFRTFDEGIFCLGKRAFFLPKNLLSL